MEWKRRGNGLKNEAQYAAQIISEGVCFDDEEPGCVYRIDTMTIRLNCAALNGWLNATCLNGRECYDTPEEWEQHRAVYEGARKYWEKQIAGLLELDEDEGSIVITRIMAEFFAVLQIRSVN